MPLDEETIETFAYDNYINKILTLNEFRADLRVAKKINGYIRRYYETPETFNPRYFINLIITFFNCFSHKAAKEMLFYYICDSNKACLKAVLIALDKMNSDEYYLVDINHEFLRYLEKELL